MRILPFIGVSSIRMLRSSVLLPQPLAPSTHVIFARSNASGSTFEDDLSS